MSRAPKLSAAVPRRIHLPRSSTRLALPYVYCKLIEDIVPQPFSACRFEGRIYRPGAPIDLEGLPCPAVVIECIGPLGAFVARRSSRRRDYGYILWSFDFANYEWREIARAQAPDATWTAALKDPAWRALHPRPELVDLVRQSQDAADELLDAIDKRLRAEMPEVKMNALYSIYERVAGRIAECA